MTSNKIAVLVIIVLVLIFGVSELCSCFETAKYFSLIIAPIIGIYYLMNSKVKNYLFLAAYTLSCIAPFFYNLALNKKGKAGLLLWFISIAIYIYFILKNREILKIESLLKLAVPFILVLVIPTYFVLKSASSDLFLASTAFTAVVLLFFYLTFIVYLSNKTTINKTLFLCGFTYALALAIGGYNGFVELIPLLRFFEVICFAASHFFICSYFLQVENKKLLKKA